MRSARVAPATLVAQSSSSRFSQPAITLRSISSVLLRASVIASSVPASARMPTVSSVAARVAPGSIVPTACTPSTSSENRERALWTTTSGYERDGTPASTTTGTGFVGGGGGFLSGSGPHATTSTASQRITAAA